MATARNAPDPPAPADDGFSETQRSQLEEMIAKVVGGAKAPETTPTGPAPKTDDEWDNMTDRARESWVRQLVDSELDKLAKDDDQRRLAADVEALKSGADKKPEPEKSPGVITRLQKLIWGDQDQK